jgi:hypothetical protein
VDDIWFGINLSCPKRETKRQQTGQYLGLTPLLFLISVLGVKLSEVAQGLLYLHSQNIVHGDLRGVCMVFEFSWRHVDGRRPGKRSHHR